MQAHYAKSATLVLQCQQYVGQIVAQSATCLDLDQLWNSWWVVVLPSRRVLFSSSQLLSQLTWAALKARHASEYKVQK